MVVIRTITILRNHNVVVDLNIIKSLVEPDVELIKAKATLVDSSILHISEVIGEGWRDYSYHWQRNNTLIRRWDNAPHHKELNNFPHHLHDAEKILPGSDVNLIDILTYIEAELKKKNQGLFSQSF